MILRFFFTAEKRPPADQLTVDDQGFAQALLLEAIDSIYDLRSELRVHQLLDRIDEPGRTAGSPLQENRHFGCMRFLSA